MYMCTAQLMRPGIGRNASCASGNWLTSRPKGCLQPRELWFFDILMYLLAYVFASGGSPVGDPGSRALLGMLARIFERLEPH